MLTPTNICILYCLSRARRICKYCWCPAVKMKNKMFKVNNYAEPFPPHIQHAKSLNLVDWEDFYIQYTCAPND